MTADTRVANLAVLSGGNVLLLERAATIDNVGKLGLAGGIVDPGDTSPLRGVLREVYEETGIDKTALAIRRHGEFMIIDRDGSNDVPDGRRLHMYLYSGRLLVPHTAIQLRGSEHRKSQWSHTERIIDGSMPPDFYDRLLAGVPTLLSYVLCGKEPAVDATLSRADLEYLG